jgi:8-oxo-dGTP pyrophosphatase MutT (NUDIX family)
VPITDSDITITIARYLTRHPDERPALADPLSLLEHVGDITSRHCYPLHVTVGALVTRGRDLLLVRHRAYGIWLQPGGHLEPSDDTLIGAALRELSEETGIDPAIVHLASEAPVYIESGNVPARPDENEPAHVHLDIGYSFTTSGNIGAIQQDEVTDAAWFGLDDAERLIGRRVTRALTRSDGRP